MVTNMIYRIDDLTENRINPVTKCEYDNSWIVLMLTDSKDYQQMCGSSNGCAYTIKISRLKCADWKMAVCDFIEFCKASEKNAILVMTEAELDDAKKHYDGHSYNESILRENEPTVLIHSTSMSSWEQIKRDGMLKSWNRLKAEKYITEEQPIGVQLGDPTDFSDYIMFGGGVTGEIVVNSRQQGKILMDTNAEYLTGARLYFDAQKMAQDGLLVRDGTHIKVKDVLPLKPYLIWAATWDKLGLESPISTPKVFAETADKQFSLLPMSHNIDFTTITACGECCVGCKKKEKGICRGCIESDGHCEEWARSKGCPIYKCAKEHKVQFCGICEEFPCNGLKTKIHWRPNVIEELRELAELYRKTEGK